MKEDPEFGYHMIGIFVKKYALTVHSTSHIEILRKHLHVYIIGDTYRVVPYKVERRGGNSTGKIRLDNNFTLDASESNDPNFVDQSLNTFEWKCRIANITSSAAQFHVLKKPCNKRDFVTLENFIIFKDGLRALNLSTKHFVEGLAYDFQVNMTSDGVSATYIQTIEFVKGAPPNIILR